MNLFSPTLLLDKARCLRNLDRMVDRAARHSVTLAPHFKTHQALEIAKWGKTRGVREITVSSIEMAYHFVSMGWESITIAFPVNILAFFQLNELARKVSLNVFVNDVEVAKALGKGMRYPVNCLIEVDTGYGRTGVLASDTETLEALVQIISDAPNLNLLGFYTHPGHTYAARGVAEISSIYRDTLAKLQQVKAHFAAKGHDVQLRLGDTPSCSTQDDFSDISHITPGNFIFYDVMQVQIGSCEVDDIAVALAVPVVETHPSRHEIIVHGGAVHLSKDAIIDENGHRIFGWIVRFIDGKWGTPVAGAYVKAISQEHGTITWEGDSLQEVKPGDLLGILPIHSCLTADLMQEYLTLDGEVIRMRGRNG